MTKIINVEIPAWVIIELIHNAEGKEFIYNLNGTEYHVKRSAV